MEHLVDLDVLADRLGPFLEECQRSAAVGPLTWRDETARWPQPITPHRSEIRVPESLGFRLRRHPDQDEFEMVVWTGGWADVIYLRDGHVLNPFPEFTDVDTAFTAVIHTVQNFLGQVVHGQGATGARPARPPARQTAPP